MTSRRTVAFGLVAWCAVVALVATLVWVVVGHAGAGVLPSAEPRADVTGSLPVPRHHRSGGDRSPAAVPSPRTSSSPSPAGPSSQPSPSSTTTTSTPAGPSANRSSAPPPSARRASWNGTAGHVVAECRGPAARLVSAYPNTGWRYQIAARGPAVVRVRFLRIDEDHGITVTARCVSGAPEFSVSGHEAGDD